MTLPITFINTYLEFIEKAINSTHDNRIIKYIIKKTVSDVQKITSRARGFNLCPYLNKPDFLTDMYKINELCLGYVFILLITIHLSKLEEKIKLEYIALIEYEANLAYWHEMTYKNVSIIKYIFDLAKKKAEEIIDNERRKNVIKKG